MQDPSEMVYFHESETSKNYLVIFAFPVTAPMKRMNGDFHMSDSQSKTQSLSEDWACFLPMSEQY